MQSWWGDCSKCLVYQARRQRQNLRNGGHITMWCAQVIPVTHYYKCRKHSLEYIVYIFICILVYIFFQKKNIYPHTTPLWSLHPFSHRQRPVPALQILQGAWRARNTNEPSDGHQGVWETHIFWRFHTQEADFYRRTFVCSFPAMSCKGKVSRRSPFWESLMMLSASCDKWLMCVPEKMPFHLQWAGS